MTAPAEANAARKRLARHLVGSGIEIGPGRYPFRLLPPGSEVRFVGQAPSYQQGDPGPDPDTDSSVGKPGTATEFVEPDIIADFNTDRLGAVADGSADFVIASHVLEHLAEPIGFIAEIYRVLRPGGVTLILLPDRRRTEDRFRTPTSLDHLVAEHRHSVTEVDDAHLVEFLKDRGRRLKGSAEERRRTLETLRRQSIHVHCWDAGEFLPVLRWGIEELGEQWEFVDGTLHEPPIHYEFGFVLRRSETDLDPVTRSREFETTWRTWWASHPENDVERPGRSHHRRLPPWAYQRARGLVRSNRLARWGYEKAATLRRRLG